jgi:glycosyltransferase involved in cell wall biosynthesis
MDGPLVSIVVPVFNVASVLGRCLDSLRAQSIGFDQLEVIAVDDGSCDGSGQLLDRFAAGRPNVTVIHQANSGGPGSPRNAGVAASRGEYVFFVDADDYLGGEAVARMYATATRNAADIVLGKLVGVGRGAPRSPFRQNLECTDVVSSNVIYSIGAQKMFRRAFLGEHGLRFAEGVRRGEDQLFVVQAYLLARVISVVADYDCYYLVCREDGQSATQQPIDAAELYPVVRRVLATIVSQLPDGPGRDRLLRRFYLVEVIGKVATPAFLELDRHVRRDLVDRAAAVVEEFLPAALGASWPAAQRLYGHLVRRRLADEIADTVDREVAGALCRPQLRDGRLYLSSPLFRDDRYGIPDTCFDITAELPLTAAAAALAWHDGELVISVVLHLGGVQPDPAWRPSLVLGERTRRNALELPLQSTAGDWRACLNLPMLLSKGALHAGLWNAYIRLTIGETRRQARLRAEPDGVRRRAAIAGDAAVIPYATMHGNLSVDIGETLKKLRPMAELEQVKWERKVGAALHLRGMAKVRGADRSVRWQPTLILRAAPGGRCIEVPLALRRSGRFVAKVEGPVSGRRWQVGVRFVAGGFVREVPAQTASSASDQRPPLGVRVETGSAGEAVLVVKPRNKLWRRRMRRRLARSRAARSIWAATRGHARSRSGH